MNEHLFGVAFDIDGTIIDNNHYHYLAFAEFYRRRNKTLDEDYFIKKFNGKTNADLMKLIFEKDLSDGEIEKLAQEKEAIYREIYAPHIKPVNGLTKLLEALKKENVPMVIATSGMPVNIEFLFQHVPIKHYFKAVICSKDITHGKPHPEIYQLAAKKLGLKPEQCIAFEDSVSGIASAKAAGLKAVAVLTTEMDEKLKNADLIVKDFTEVNADILQKMME